MKNEQIVPFNFGQSEVRAFFVLGFAWWVGADVCELLKMQRPRDAISRLDDDEKISFADLAKLQQGAVTDRTLLQPYNSPGGRQPLAFLVNEWGFNQLILTSRMPEAKHIRRVLTHEVMPSIRRYGYYAASGRPMSQQSMLVDARTFLLAEHKKCEDAGHELTERAMRNEITRKILTEHPEWLHPLIAKIVHDWVYHDWARKERRKGRDPKQLELLLDYNVMKDGRERYVPREGLTRENKDEIIDKGEQVRAGLLKWNDRILRHDRALVAEHNSLHPETAYTDDELKLRAPALFPAGVPK